MTPTHRSALLPRKQFLARVGVHGMIGAGVLAMVLGVGVLGYHSLENLSWVDAFANAAMILSGMGPLADLKTTAGKLFIGSYAIFSGVIFLTTVGFFLTPIVHRLLHRLHLESAFASRDD